MLGEKHVPNLVKNLVKKVEPHFTVYTRSTNECVGIYVDIYVGIYGCVSLIQVRIYTVWNNGYLMILMNNLPHGEYVFRAVVYART